MSDHRRYFTVAEAAEHLRIGHDAVRDGIKAGDLPAKRHGISPRAPYRILESALDDWFDGWQDA